MRQAAGAGVASPCGPRPRPGTRFGPVRRFAEIDSTNRYLLDEARAGAPEGAVAVADYQSAGRGRLGRRWEAPPGSNLLTSVLLRPALAVDELHLCTVAVALAAAAACEGGRGVVPELKWPNDLMVGGRKLGGILAEALPAGTGATAPMAGRRRLAGSRSVGLGLNVRLAASRPGIGPRAAGSRAHRQEPIGTRAGLGDGHGADAPGARAATSIRREVTEAALEPLVLLGLVLEELEPRLVDLADATGRRRLTSEYRRRCATVGRTVRSRCPVRCSRARRPTSPPRAT